MNERDVGILAIIFLIVVMIAAGPFITIWALNTVFGLNIAFTIWTWLAVFWLTVLVAYAGSGNKTNKK